MHHAYLLGPVHCYPQSSKNNPSNPVCGLGLRVLVVTFLNCGCPKCPTILKNNPSNPVCGLGLWCWLSPSSIVGVQSVVEAAGWPPAPWHFGGSSRQNHGVPFKSTVSISISISISLPDMSSTSNQYDKEEVRKTGCYLQVAVLYCLRCKVRKTGCYLQVAILYCLRCKAVKYLPVVNNPPSSDLQIQRAAHLVYLGYLPPPPPPSPALNLFQEKQKRVSAACWHLVNPAQPAFSTNPLDALPSLPPLIFAHQLHPFSHSTSVY